MFALAVRDRKEVVLHLSRDRVGEKLLYYGWMGSTFVLGQSSRPLRRHPSFRAEVDPNALAL